MNDEVLINAITKAIAYTENGGKLDIDNPKKGASGEMKSIFQFTPATWKGYSKQVFGKEMPLNADNETYVVQQKVKSWLERGYTPEQIASMWNAGTSEPNAHTGKFSDGSPSIGKNKYGVKFDVPSYSKKVVKYVDQFAKGDTDNKEIAQNDTKETDTENKDPLSTIMSIVKSSVGTKAEAKETKTEQPKTNSGGLIQALLTKRT